MLATGLLLALALVIFGRGGAAAGPRAGAIALLGILAAFAFASARHMPPPFRERPGAIGWFVLALLGLSAAGAWRAFYLHASINTLAVWGAAAAAYVVALITGLERKTNERLRVGLSLLGVAFAIPLLLPGLAGFLPDDMGFVNANHLAALFASLLPLALGAVLFMNRGRSYTGTALVGAVSAIICATGLHMTGSRGGIIAAAGGLICFGALTLRYRRGMADGRRRSGAVWGLCIIALAISLSIYAGGGALERFRPAAAGSESSLAFRLSIWRSSLEAVREGGPLGWGLGSYTWVYPAYRERGIPYRVQHAHNDWLEQTVEMGWAFPLLGLGLAGALARRAFRTCRSSPDRVAVGSAVSGLSGLVALGVHALVDSPLQMPPLLWLAAALAGLVSASGSIERRGRSLRTGPRRGWVLGFAASGCALVTLLLSIGPWREARADAAITRAGFAMEALAMEDAVGHARDAAKLDPTSAKAFATLGRLLLGARVAGVGGRLALKEAQHALGRATDQNPRDAAAFLDLARIAEMRNDERAAAAAYETAVSLDPVSGKMLDTRARFLLRTGLEAEALESLRASVKADARGLSRVLPLLWAERKAPALLRAVTPETAPARVLLGDFLDTQGYFEAADKAFSEAVALDGESATALLKRARLALKQGHFDDALAWAREARPLARGAPEAARTLASALTVKGEIGPAADLYEEILARDARDKSAVRALAHLSVRLGEPERAIAAWKRVARALPGDPGARHELALAHRAAGEWSEAVEVCRTVSVMYPDEAACRSLLVELYLEHGVMPPAKRILDAWIARAPGSVKARTSLARYFEASERPEDARREYERILTLDPGNPVAQTALVRIERGEGAS